MHGTYNDIDNKMHWGNIVAQAGVNYRVSDSMTAEFTAAYTRFFSSMKHIDNMDIYRGVEKRIFESYLKTDNNINDWIFRGDFDWLASERSHVRFGAGYTRHSFLPGRSSKKYITESEEIVLRDSTWAFRANELNGYIEDDWKINDRWRINAGLHASLFHIDGKVKGGVSPRLSASYRPAENYAVKAAYSRTVQYVHQLSECYMQLPSDQWIPITGRFKPQTADKISAGAYWQSEGQKYTVAVEGYWKWMHHLLDYRFEHYLSPPMEKWDSRLTSGKGTAKGIDVTIEKRAGKITGHIAYSLGWADRTFADRNGGRTYPARCDNRHTVNVFVNWNISDRVSVNASWTGHTGNRYTLAPQMWEEPSFDGSSYWTSSSILKTAVNNYRLPFYHRLDLACTVRNSRGYWTFSLYNAYNHLNTIGIWRGYKDVDDPTVRDRQPPYPYSRKSKCFLSSLQFHTHGNSKENITISTDNSSCRML